MPSSTTTRDAHVKRLMYVAMITAIGTLGLAACGDDTKSPALPATTPVAVVTSAMVDNTTAMVDNTTAMVDNTTAMNDGSTATTGG